MAAAFSDEGLQRRFACCVELFIGDGRTKLSALPSTGLPRTTPSGLLLFSGLVSIQTRDKGAVKTNCCSDSGTILVGFEAASKRQCIEHLMPSASIAAPAPIQPSALHRATDLPAKPPPDAHAP